MRFGTMNLFPLPQGESDREVIEQALEEAQIADELGFDSIWFAEHHFSRYGILGNPLVFAAAVAQRTKRIKIGTAVMVIPFYNPLRLAEDAALVDIMSNGRLVLGVGSGYSPLEFGGFGIDREEKTERYNEIIDILRLAWTQDNWSYEGKHYQYRNVSVHPRPLNGTIPILHAATRTENFKRLGQAGERLITSPNFTPLGIMKKNFDLYDAGLREAGLKTDQYERPFMQQAWCGDPAQGGRHEAAEAALRYYHSIKMVIPGASEGAVEGASDPNLAYYAKVRKGIDLLTLEQTLTHGGNFGSPDQVADTIRVLRDQMGVDHYISWFRIPTLDRRTAIKAMESFARDVMPVLRRESAQKTAA